MRATVAAAAAARSNTGRKSLFLIKGRHSRIKRPQGKRKMFGRKEEEKEEEETTAHLSRLEVSVQFCHPLLLRLMMMHLLLLPRLPHLLRKAKHPHCPAALRETRSENLTMISLCDLLVKIVRPFVFDKK